MKKEPSIDDDLRAQFSRDFYEFVEVEPPPKDSADPGELSRKLDAIAKTMTQGTTATVIATDHPEIRDHLTPQRIASAIGGRPVFDGRNIFGRQVNGTSRVSFKEVYEAGVNYISIGRPPVGPNFGPPAEEFQLAPLDPGFTAPRFKVLIVGAGYVGLTTAALLSADFMGHEVTVADIDRKRILALRNPENEFPIDEPGLDELIRKNQREGRLVFIHAPARASKFLKSLAVRAALRAADVILLAVGTPQGDDGDVDLGAIFTATENIGKLIKRQKKSAAQRSEPPRLKVIVVKSTVPPKAFDSRSIVDVVRSEQENVKTIKSILIGMGLKYGVDFVVVSNPEFLKEGTILRDVMGDGLDRTVLGSDSLEALRRSQELYGPLQKHREHPIVISDLVNAPMIKYASNVWLAISISLANDFARLAEELGASYSVMERIARNDDRIGEKAFIGAGIGWGGSCFPKDTKAALKIVVDAIGSIVGKLVDLGKETWKRVSEGVRDAGKSFFPIATKAIQINGEAPRFAVGKIKKLLADSNGRLDGKQIALLGLAFKADTDDVRESRSMNVLKELLDSGAKVTLFDPSKKARSNFARDLAYSILLGRKVKSNGRLIQEEISKIIESAYPDRVEIKSTMEEAIQGSHLLVLATDWQEIKEIDFARAKSLMLKSVVAHTEDGGVIEAPIVMDGRNMLLKGHTKEELKKSGFLIMFIGEENIEPERKSPEPAAPVAQASSLGISSGASQLKPAVRRLLAPQGEDDPRIIRDARQTAKRIFAPALWKSEGHLVLALKPRSPGLLRKVLEPLALSLRSEAKNHVEILIPRSNMEEGIRRELLGLKVSRRVIAKYVHFRSMARPDAAWALRNYLSGLAGTRPVVMVGDTDFLAQVEIPEIRKISRDQVYTESGTRAVESENSLVAEIAAVDLGLGLLSSPLVLPYPDQLKQEGSLLLMKKNFLEEFAARWTAQLHGELKCLISA